MAQPATILLVDDDLDARGTWARWLAAAGYRVLLADDGHQALGLFLARQPDLVLLDVIMPQMDGLELCRQIRAVSLVPIVFLSILGAEREKAWGLALGADDYLAKPVGHGELLARIAALLRRTAPPRQATGLYQDLWLTLDPARHTATAGGHPLSLTPTEFGILRELIQRRGEAVTNVQLLGRVWGPAYQERGLVKWHLSRLRRKLELAGLPLEAIVSVRGVGYRYEPDVRAGASASEEV
ncbi:MAG: response regulator transcription factor [Chloroflexi bacterium]|nr:response regulator transcription factor [Chloroflexota bacterium]